MKPGLDPLPSPTSSDNSRLNARRKALAEQQFFWKFLMGCSDIGAQSYKLLKEHNERLKSFQSRKIFVGFSSLKRESIFNPVFQALRLGQANFLAPTVTRVSVFTKSPSLHLRKITTSDVKAPTLIAETKQTLVKKLDLKLNN